MAVKEREIAYKDKAWPPLSVATKATMPSLKRCISVYEPHASYYAQLGRIMVTYDVKLNSWQVKKILPP